MVLQIVPEKILVQNSLVILHETKKSQLVPVHCFQMKIVVLSRGQHSTIPRLLLHSYPTIFRNVVIIYRLIVPVANEGARKLGKVARSIDDVMSSFLAPWFV